jgi:hypothetical protein
MAGNPARQKMNWKLKTGIALVVVSAVAGGTVAILKKHSAPGVTVTLRIGVTPGAQADFVAGRGNSAQFKYLMGKQSGVKPVLAQKLALKQLAHTAVVEARISVLTKDEGRRYVEVFVPPLQDLCGKQAELILAEQSIR